MSTCKGRLIITSAGRSRRRDGQSLPVADRHAQVRENQEIQHADGRGRDPSKLRDRANVPSCLREGLADNRRERFGVERGELGVGEAADAIRDE